MTTYYVDHTASDDNGAGTSTADPWKTISKVNGATFSTGDSVLFKRDGIWREQLTVPATLVGNGQTPTVIGAYGTGGAPRITGLDLTTTWAANGVHNNLYEKAETTANVAFLFEDGAALTYVTWDTDIATTYASMSAGTWTFDDTGNMIYAWCTDGLDPDTHTMEFSKRSYCITMADHSHVTIQNLELYGVRTSCVYYTSTGAGSLPGLVVDDCNIHHFKAGGVHIENAATAAHDLKVTDCSFRDQWPGSAGAAIRGSTTSGNSGAIWIEHNYFNACSHGIWFDSAATDQMHVLRNTFTQSEDDFIFLVATTGAMLRHNAIWYSGDDGFDLDACPNTKIYHNTVAYSTSAALNIKAGTTGLSVKNNIFYENNQGAGAVDEDVKVVPTDATLDYNCYYNSSSLNLYWEDTRYNTLAAWQAASSQDANSTTNDPLLTDAASGDLELQRASPCWGAGTNLSLGRVTDLVGDLISHSNMGAFHLSRR